MMDIINQAIRSLTESETVEELDARRIRQRIESAQARQRRPEPFTLPDTYDMHSAWRNVHRTARTA